MSNRVNFIGLDRFIWWIGIVEDVADPLATGRCRVRIFGWHTDNKEMLPTEDLPWAVIMLPPTQPRSFSVIGLKDQWVMGFFMDGESAQFPIVMGVIPAINPLTTEV